jgi:aminoglycoside phosphotransferase (APT) family kinase protein
MRGRLANYLGTATGARNVEIEALRRLPDGAVQENWLLAARWDGGRLSGSRSMVLRTDAPTSLGFGLSRREEFAVLRLVSAAGIAVPDPILLCEDVAVIGKPFLLIDWLSGTAAGAAVVTAASGPAGETLAGQLARELARLHRIRPPVDALACLGVPPTDPAQRRLAELTQLLATDPEPRPVAAWAVRWLRRHAPPPADVALCHGDFRTGNYLADAQGLRGLLDWEFASWSDPDEDLGWFCLGCWRFGAYQREAGGIAARAVFYRAYEAASGRKLDTLRLRYWEVMAALRWLVIALRQRDRFLIGGERSLDLALTGRRTAECDYEILRLTKAE